MLTTGGCGTRVNHKRPEAVAKSLISAYQKEDEKAVKKCFGLEPKKECAKEIQQEIDYNMNFFKAHEASGIEIERAESLGNIDEKELVYVWYNYEMKGKRGKEKAPALAFYFVQKKDKKYYVVPAKEVTEEMSDMSGQEYQKFIKTEDYKAYEKQYQRFIRKNPKYENALKNRFSELSK